MNAPLHDRRTAQFAAMICSPLLRRPGAGWKRAGRPDVPVWDHVSGIRVHTSGLVTINGVVHSAFQTPEYWAYWKAIARQGMNRRRGAMVWALEKARSMANSTDQPQNSTNSHK